MILREGQVWRERWAEDEDSLLLILGVERMPSGRLCYKALNLDTGELDWFDCLYVDDPNERWERVA